MFSEVIVVAVPALSSRRVFRVTLLAPRLRIVLLVICTRCLIRFVGFYIPLSFHRILFSINLFLIFAFALTLLPLGGFLLVLLIFEILVQLLPHLLDLVLVWHLDFHDQWSDLDASLWRRHVSEIVFECLFPLDTAVSNLANFIAVKFLPFLIIELLEKLIDVYWVDEVDEGIPHVAPVLKVDREVEEVILVLCLSIDSLKNHVLGVLVRDVSDHYRSTHIFTVRDRS